MPLFSHTHRSSSSLPTSYESYSSKLLKPLKPSSAPPTSRFPLPILVFSLLCFLFGLSATIFAVYSLRRPIPVPSFRCGRSEDTFRAFYSTSSSRKLGDRGALVERPKLLGFVGIQTVFGSVDRRAALRSTWFPSDPDGLLRYLTLLISSAQSMVFLLLFWNVVYDQFVLVVTVFKSTMGFAYDNCSST